MPLICGAFNFVHKIKISKFITYENFYNKSQGVSITEKDFKRFSFSIKIFCNVSEHNFKALHIIPH